MTSQLKVDKLQGRTTAGSIVVTSEGTSVETNLQQGLAKSWFLDNSFGTGLDTSGATEDSFNTSTRTDGGTGRLGIQFTNNFAAINFSTIGIGSGASGNCTVTSNYNAITTPGFSTGATNYFLQDSNAKDNPVSGAVFGDLE